MGEIIATLVAEICKWIFISIIFDLVIKIPGYAIARMLVNSRQKQPRREISPDGAMSICCGLLFWAGLSGIGYSLYRAWK
ncbi:hypothetical protein [Chamaesiphon sp. GL140_3_metabinner_50]|uniref:hypothetical protein n=1 Tax=Chamaesiphon sp. GL140_3_metabinner_50 TaxID=2970812 RepID=UPI0025DB611B|nr:hypothetical protein [Chamaesiphon sp. GL140_3_metabinner_50]